MPDHLKQLEGSDISQLHTHSSIEEERKENKDTLPEDDESDHPDIILNWHGVCIHDDPVSMATTSTSTSKSLERASCAAFNLPFSVIAVGTQKSVKLIISSTSLMAFLM
jgi:hypothetical protein